MADILIGNVRGPQGETGATGAQGEQGDAATIAVGSTTTVPYGQAARVTNSGTAQEAVFDFVIPQGRPGEQVTKIDNLTIDAITEPSTQFPVPAVSDNGSTLFGKISKWFSDMTALVATKLNVANVVNNLTTAASGYALDARQGKTLDDYISGAIAVVPMTVTQQVNVAAGATVSVNFGKPSVPGFTPLLFCYASAGTSNLVIVQGNSAYYYSNTRTVVFRNITSGTYSANVTFSAFVLMIKNHLYGDLKASS